MQPGQQETGFLGTFQPKSQGNTQSVNALSRFTSMFDRKSRYVVRVSPTQKGATWRGYGTGRARSKQKLTKWQVFNLVRRLAVVAAAFQYLSLSMLATRGTLEVLLSVPAPKQSFGVLKTSLIAGYLGDHLIRDSKLVQDILGGDTRPRDHILFLESDTQVSTSKCTEVPRFNPNIYNYDFLTRTYEEITNDSSYNTTVLTDLELVVVVVDCTSTPLTRDDLANVRLFNLVRSRKDPTDIFLVDMLLSMQDYAMQSHKKFGPALALQVSIIQDMQQAITKTLFMMALTYPYQRALKLEVYDFIRITHDSHTELRSVPRDPTTDPIRHLITSRKRGFYNHDVQSNLHSVYSKLDLSNGKAALTTWEYYGESQIDDAWAWVHGIHFFFGTQTLLSLVIVAIVSYQKIKVGKIWIGDPFSSVSTLAFVSRGFLVVISWYINAFWTLREYALMNAATLSRTEPIHVHEELVHCDVLVVFLGFVAFLSWLARERIDPAVAIFLFELVHDNRLRIIATFPAVLSEVVSYSSWMNQLGDVPKTAAVAAMSPLSFWCTIQIPQVDIKFLAASFSPKVGLLVLFACYAALRKLYRKVFPERVIVKSGQSVAMSGNDKSKAAVKGHLTNFEISTGAELQTRFGIISDYNNYVYFKGMKFASADGVYCSGYVIVNNKLLVRSKQLLGIIMMKIVRTRLTNIYAYEVDGNTVKDTARLVFPETFHGRNYGD
ncbi:hypothetical protein L915_01473 [Plasmopara halstedii]|uniref:Transmembrane protein n=1 Tax=Plasmopara halstedii TaxID=4781 RepID=A0A0P1AJE8_PLAHL|nr:hypothetical protein L915_01473 [Plasmopara halstedii]CEG41476.1 hypothetical protein L915_01473 [Plasmopara halstedii]|eukprot:XP_024577845.1 hypothetical protein L915_01473 [Plasmopara halstedii]